MCRGGFNVLSFCFFVFCLCLVFADFMMCYDFLEYFINDFAELSYFHVNGFLFKTRLSQLVFCMHKKLWHFKSNFSFSSAVDRDGYTEWGQVLQTTPYLPVNALDIFVFFKALVSTFCS